jgi:hypothetical protein
MNDQVQGLDVSKFYIAELVSYGPLKKNAKFFRRPYCAPSARSRRSAAG